MTFDCLQRIVAAAEMRADSANFPFDDSWRLIVNPRDYAEFMSDHRVAMMGPQFSGRPGNIQAFGAHVIATQIAGEGIVLVLRHGSFMFELRCSDYANERVRVPVQPAIETMYGFAAGDPRQLSIVARIPNDYTAVIPASEIADAGDFQSSSERDRANAKDREAKSRTVTQPAPSKVQPQPTGRKFDL